MMEKVNVEPFHNCLSKGPSGEFSGRTGISCQKSLSCKAPKCSRLAPVTVAPPDGEAGEHLAETCRLQAEPRQKVSRFHIAEDCKLGMCSQKKCANVYVIL